jgi:hypothetical protein
VPWLYEIKNGSGPIDEAAFSNTPDPNFRWSATDQQWIFNLKTVNLSAGNVYIYRIYLADGTEIPFQFGLR